MYIWREEWCTICWKDNLKNFAAIVQKGNNFCRQEVASLVFETFQKWGLLLTHEALMTTAMDNILIVFIIIF